ncbi:DoxX family protein [Nesterenkonia rhizosphaerae]|uniref:DoxX family protein n=1 Tax=Nesterenkonia rhizosphaerae TaxID=1348272 RepID=A0ABP9G277_9MICC
MLHPSSRFPVFTDVALLVARVALGIILVAHGWQKFNEWTIAGTGQAFESMGIPAAGVAAPFVAGAELIGGAALILGVLTPFAALVNMIGMLGALVLVHAPAGLFVDEGGYELVLAIFAGLVVLLLMGGGRFSVDSLLTRARSSK